MTLHQLRAVLAGLLLFAVVLFPVHAQEEKTSAAMTPELLEKIRKSNNECFACHSEEGFKNPPKVEMDLAKLRTLLQDTKAFNGSNHGLMECKQCHGQGYNDFPHAADAKEKLSPCEECHAVKVLRIEMQFDASVHAINVREKFTCNTCHSPHIDLIASKLIDPRKIVAQDNRHCLDCHDSDLQFAKFAPDDEKTLLKKARPNIDIIHDWLPNTRRHWQRVRCIECHTPEGKGGKILSHQIMDKEKAEKRCLACHNTNSSLMTRLYRHLIKEEQQKQGFISTVMLSNVYVLGATRNQVFDGFLMITFGALLIGLLLHGLGRIVVRLMQRRNNHG